MSTATTAAPSAPSVSSAAPSTPQPSKGLASTETAASTPESGKAAEGTQGSDQATSAIEEALEEIKVGSTTLKLKKAEAKLIKDLERGFHSKAQETASIRNYLSQVAEQAKTNPLMAEKLFEELGIDADAFSQARLAKKLEREMMDPNERKAQDYEQRLKQYEEQERARKDADQKQQMTMAEQREDKILRDGMMKSWQSSGLPADPRFGAWMAATMSAANEQGVDFTWDQCAAKVKKDFFGHVQGTASQLDPALLEELVGRESLSKWREHDVKRVTGQSAPKSSANGPGSSPASKQSQSSDKPKVALTEREWRAHFAKLAEG